MFREMLRVKQQLPREECVRLLKEEKRGVLSVLGDDGYPYGMPLNHYYCEEDGKLYFHGGKLGHKIDALRQNNKASFCVYDQGVRQEGEWFLRIRSVIVFGTVDFITDPEKIADISRRLSHKFTQDEQYIENEIRRVGPGTLLLALTPAHMTGKLVKEA